jgi:hypothetical protein
VLTAVVSQYIQRSEKSIEHYLKCRVRRRQFPSSTYDLSAIPLSSSLVALVVAKFIVLKNPTYILIHLEF